MEGSIYRKGSGENGERRKKGKIEEGRRKGGRGRCVHSPGIQTTTKPRGKIHNVYDGSNSSTV